MRKLMLATVAVLAIGGADHGYPDCATRSRRRLRSALTAAPATARAVDGRLDAPDA